MNFNIYKEKDKSGKLFRENYVSKHHIEEYQYIISYSIKNDFIDLLFKEKVYLCINNIKEIPICNNENCNNKVSFRNSTLGYYEFCCNNCVSSSKIVKDRVKKTNNELFGCDYPSQNPDILQKQLKIVNKTAILFHLF